ncbi:Actin-related protein 10 [Phytophthora citrophthora]|uniref:Actin-related protein 10 n=1 Tax=Phytophthora citrophthora TaxID=4793 RepID=A0AAD9GMN2_9STRA|nr:Actin-related protein 10 [Phytophthora citrophthora]
MSSSLSDKSALVLDLGARYARCGISGERAPRCVERWQVGDMLQKPLSAAEWGQYLYPKLHALCFDLLLVNPTRRRFVVCEDLLLPQVFRETLLHILFEVLKASAVTMVPSMMAVLYATANHTALVVDCGWAETRLLPVFKGIPLPYLYETVSVGSRNCCEVIKRELDASRDQPMDGSQLAMPVTEAMAEDILERACFAQQKDPLPNVVDAEFKTQDNDILQVKGYVCVVSTMGLTPRLLDRSLETCALLQWSSYLLSLTNNQGLKSPFLAAGDNSTEGTSIVDGIIHVMKKAPLDIRAAMLENLLLVGGTAMIPGLAQRVVAEVREALRHDNEFASASEGVDRAQVVQTYFPRNMLAWVGGSIYAATDSARVSAISSQEYSSSKGTSIPDWLTVAEEEF